MLMFDWNNHDITSALVSKKVTKLLTAIGFDVNSISSLKRTSTLLLVYPDVETFDVESRFPIVLLSCESITFEHFHAS